MEAGSQSRDQIAARLASETAADLLGSRLPKQGERP